MTRASRLPSSSSKVSPRTLGTSLHGPAAIQVIRAALKAADPYQAVQSAINRTGLRWEYAGGQVLLARDSRAWFVGFGKAGIPMAQAVAEVAGEKLAGGVVVVKDGYANHQKSVGPIKVLEASHPIPDERSKQAAQEMIHLLHEIPPGDLVICGISGGGSALVSLPVPGVTLADLQTLTHLLLRCGATIQEINTLRKHLDLVKGGRLVNYCAPARLLALILSDVVGDDLAVIASGPTVPDPTTFSQAWDVLEKFLLFEKTPVSILEHLRAGMNGAVPETPKPHDPVFEKVTNLLVGSNRMAAEAALAAAATAGYTPHLFTLNLQGEARLQGPFFASLAKAIQQGQGPVHPPACVVAGGETTVTLRGNGLGGRNQELALSAVRGMAGLENVLLFTLATDGGDGPTDAAGAVVSGESLARAQELGLSPEEYLEQNDAYSFFLALGDLVQTGPSLTNVNDLVVLFVG